MYGLCKCYIRTSCDGKNSEVVLSVKHVQALKHRLRHDFHRKKNFINTFSLMYVNNTFLDKIYTSSNLLLGPKIKSKYLFLYKTNILFLTLHSLSFASM